VFLFGIGGKGIRRFSVTWHDKKLYNLVYAFVYRLYDPGAFSDPSYVEMVPSLQKGDVTYTITVVPKTGVDGKKLICPSFCPIYAINPFGSRTHILANPKSETEVDGRVLTVLKDQLCRIGTRFDEHSILTLIHSPETVPGVVEDVYYEVIKVPSSLDVSRNKHRLGLRQLGSPITSIPTLKGMLELVFDVLEGTSISINTVPRAHMFAVLRYLRFNRRVLHRDISKGNILYIEEGTTPPPDAGPGGPKTTGGKEVSPCFIKYLLGERYVEVSWDCGC
jgi:hypothetical protein